MPNKITVHWTVGRYNQTFNDYHYCITYDNNLKKAYVKKGVYKPEDNDNTGDGKYAPHCYLCNTGNIGIGICSMYGYKNPQNVGDFPITREQIELTFELCAELCVKYNININEVQTHYERDRKLKKPSGKIDIIYLPPFPDVKQADIGNFIRNKVKWYFSKKNKNNLRLI